VKETKAITEGIVKLGSEPWRVVDHPRSKHVDPVVLSEISEKEFQRQVVYYATRQGWEVFHVFDSRRSEPGWVDLTMARASPRGTRLVLAELKTTTGKLSAAQLSWGELLSAVGGNVEYHLWRPEQWAEIMEVLA